MTRKTLLIEGRKLSYIDWGDPGKDILLCLHGLTRNAHDFDYLARYLQGSFRVIAPDMAGHGDSDYLPDYRKYHYSLFLKDVMSLIETLGTRSVYWLGTSLGGIIGFYAFAEYPGLIKKLILNDVGPQFAPNSFSGMQDISIDSVRSSYVYPSYEACMGKVHKMFSGFKFPTRECQEHMTKYSIKMQQSGLYSMNFDVGVLSLFINTDNVIRKEGVWDIWKKIDVPILEMWGRRSALLTPPIIEQMRALNSNLTVCTCLSDGHTCNLLEESQLSVIKTWLLASGHVADSTLQ